MDRQVDDEQQHQGNNEQQVKTKYFLLSLYRTVWFWGANVFSFFEQAYQSTFTLLELNDDCLREIFRDKGLDAKTQCAIADTCGRFKRIILEVAPKNIILPNCNATTFTSPSRLMRRFFGLFGERATSFSIEFDYAHHRNTAGEFIKDSWNFIRRYRNNKSPELVFYVRINGQLAIKVEPGVMWMRGPRYYGNDNALIMNCNSLNRLDILEVFHDWEILKHFYPKLKHLSYEMLTKEFKSMFAVTEFFSRHSTLESISLWISKVGFSGRGGVVRRNLLHAIGKSCILLEDLKVNVGQTDIIDDLVQHANATNTFGFEAEIHPLRNLTSLQRLTLTNIHDSFECFKPFTQLHELTLHNCLLPGDYNEFRFLVPLRRLRILSQFLVNPALGHPYVIGMVKELTNLNYLKIFNARFVLDLSTYREIVETVRNRSGNLTLECEINFRPTTAGLNYVNCIWEMANWLKIFEKIEFFFLLNICRMIKGNIMHSFKYLGHDRVKSQEKDSIVS